MSDPLVAIETDAGQIDELGDGVRSEAVQRVQQARAETERAERRLSRDAVEVVRRVAAFFIARGPNVDRHQNLLWMQPAVVDAALVRVLERLRQLAQQIEAGRAVQTIGASAFEEAIQAFGVGVMLEDQSRPLLRVRELLHAQDAVVGDAVQQLVFPLRRSERTASDEARESGKMRTRRFEPDTEVCSTTSRSTSLTLPSSAMNSKFDHARNGSPSGRRALM